MKFHQLADSATAPTRSPLSRSGVHDALRRSLYFSVCVMLTGTVGTVGAMGTGSGGGGDAGGGGGGGGWHGGGWHGHH